MCSTVFLISPLLSSLSYRCHPLYPQVPSNQESKAAINSNRLHMQSPLLHHTIAKPALLIIILLCWKPVTANDPHPLCIYLAVVISDFSTLYVHYNYVISYFEKNSVSHSFLQICNLAIWKAAPPTLGNATCGSATYLALHPEL